MSLKPKARWLQVVRGHRLALMRADPKLYSEVLRKSLPEAPGVDPAQAAKVQKLLSKQGDYAAEIAARLAAQRQGSGGGDDA